MQNENLMAKGAILNTPDNRDIHIAAAVGVGKVHPKKNITDVSMLDIENQLRHGTCVGQAEGKGAEFREFKESGKVLRLSKRFLYTQCKLVDGDPFGQGTQPRVAAKVLNEKGIPREALVPDINSASYDEYLDVKVTDDILTDASTYRTKGYAFCYNLEDIKTAIDEAGIMNATAQCDDWNDMPVRPTDENSYHRILVIGYEDDDTKQDTKIHYLNSWGKGHGENGKGWFWYSEYKKDLYDMMVYTDMPNEVIDYAKKQRFIFARDLQRGMSGPDVMELQKRLSDMIALDGKTYYRGINGAGEFLFTNYFGVNTFEAVQRYQKDKGIAKPGDLGYGRLGPKTRASLNEVVVVKKTLVDAIIQVESAGNDFAVGDKHLKDRAYGPMQIRKPVCLDVNKALGTNYKAEDMLGNRKLSIEVFHVYQSLYATEKALKRPVTDEDRARIWNGGPLGYKKSATVGYWAKVSKVLG